MEPILETETLAQLVANAALDKKALDLVVIDVRGLSSYTDVLILASGTSDRHVEAIAQGAVTELKREHEHPPIGVEGLREGQWALVDFGDVILHVFHQFARDVYSLEELWSEAPRLELELDVPTADQPSA